MLTTDISGVYQTEYNCHDIRIEQAKVEAFRMQVASCAKIDWRSVAGFMGERCDAEPTPSAQLDLLTSIGAFFSM